MLSHIQFMQFKVTIYRIIKAQKCDLSAFQLDKDN